ncbi:MAG: DUF5681 domain-containing protein [Bacteroidales bacterium]|jgi:hypothetical protein|nr:DUF5681 domain-containing protein [Bacteroidales bacterium]
MAQFKKGETGNPAGRPTGSKNKATTELREVISNVRSQEMTPAKLKTILNSLEPAQRINYLIKLSEFVLPKLTATSMEVNLEKLSDGTIDAIIGKLTSNQ